MAKKRKKLWVLITSVIIFAVLIGLVIFLWTQFNKDQKVFVQDDEVAQIVPGNWQAYQSDYYRMSYPASCTVSVQDPTGAFCPGDTQGVERLEHVKFDDCNFVVEVYSNPNGLALAAWDDLYHDLTCTGAGMSYETPMGDSVRGLFGCCSTGQKAMLIPSGENVVLVHAEDHLGLATNAPDAEMRRQWLYDDIDDSDDYFNRLLGTLQVGNEDMGYSCPPGLSKRFSNCSCSYECGKPGATENCLQECPGQGGQ
ncbi:hypothetical protein ACFL2M_02025 [Patescibacteria group bacterium]